MPTEDERDGLWVRRRRPGSDLDFLKSCPEFRKSRSDPGINDDGQAALSFWIQVGSGLIWRRLAGVRSRFSDPETFFQKIEI
jgi:hypothetical protein